MDLAYLRQLNRALDYKELDPDTKEGRAYYVDLHPGGTSEVGEIGTHILLNDSSVQGLTGPSGSGKSTELLRLRKHLVGEGYWVAYIDMLRYLPASTPVGVVDFLVAVALGVADAAEPTEPESVAHRLWERIKLLRVNLQPELELAAGPVKVNLKAELKANESFVERLRRELEPNLAAFTGEIHAFIAQSLPDRQPSVVLVDQTEKISGSREVHASIRDLFLHHGERLRLSGAHIVYTLPPYLPILATGILKTFDTPVRQVLSIKLHDHGSTSIIRETLDVLRAVVARRSPEWELLLSKEQLGRVSEASGGQLRDLFLLLREVIGVTVTRKAVHPVSDLVINAAISNVRSQFGLMTAENAALLRAIHSADGMYLPSENQILPIADLLQTHVLLVHRNGEWWWEIHPLAQGIVGT